MLDGYYTGSAADFSQLIGNDSIIVYKMDKSWNSYCPDAMVGLWTIAGLFYPEYFSGDVPTVPVAPNSPTDLSATTDDLVNWNGSKVIDLAAKTGLTTTCFIPTAVFNVCWVEVGMISRKLAMDKGPLCIHFVE